MRSFLDQDKYSFTVGQAVLNNPSLATATVEYKLINRSNEDICGIWDNIRYKLDDLDNFGPTEDELDYLLQIGFNSKYIEWLSHYTLDPTIIRFENNELYIKDKWARAIYWEIPLTTIIARTLSQSYDFKVNISNQMEIATNKSIQIPIPFAEFGTRRRFSYEVQSRVLEGIKDAPNFIGTSNLHFAKILNLKPIGTVSHQWYSAFEALYGLRDANELASAEWQKNYPGSVGLTDTFSSALWWMQMATNPDSALHNFKTVRQDSGNPINYFRAHTAWLKAMGKKVNDHTILFSDSLNVRKIQELSNIMNKMIEKPKASCAIGTYFTNDVPGYRAPQITFKLWKINGKPCIKISDDPGKASGINIENKYTELNNLITHINRQNLSR